MLRYRRPRRAGPSQAWRHGRRSRIKDLIQETGMERETLAILEILRERPELEAFALSLAAEQARLAGILREADRPA